MTRLPNMIDELALKVKSARRQLNICATHHLPLSGSCCLCLLPTAGPGSPRAPPERAPGPAPDWPCCCPCYEVSGEAISSTGDRTASHLLLCPHLLSAPPHMSRRPLSREDKKNQHIVGIPCEIYSQSPQTTTIFFTFQTCAAFFELSIFANCSHFSREKSFCLKQMHICNGSAAITQTSRPQSDEIIPVCQSEMRRW